MEISKTLENDIVVVTEETNSNNDNKIFKKIPIICDLLNIKCFGLPLLITEYKDDISILVKNTNSP